MSKPIFFMHYKIACGVTITVVMFAICSAIGDKIPYEVALTGLLAVLTYWAQAPARSIEGKGGGDDATHE